MDDVAMESPVAAVSEPEPSITLVKVPKKRGRPRKVDLEAASRASSSSRDASAAPPTPLPVPRAVEEAIIDPLAEQEYALFGTTGTEEVLPFPPADGSSGSGFVGVGGVGGAVVKRSIGAADPSAPIGRAKRPKNVKFSPAKGGKVLARRAMATASGQPKSSMTSEEREYSSLPKHRQPKSTTIIPIQERSVQNNGDIIIVPRRDPPRMMDDYEELTVNRVRYQVPEETVILDFWGRVNEGPKMRGLRSPQRKQVSEKLNAVRFEGSRESSPDSTRSSPLTSLGELSDADPPEVATLGYSPYSKRTHRRPLPLILPDTTMLDSLAMIAEGFFDHFSSSTTITSTNNTTQQADDGSSSSRISGASSNNLSIRIPPKHDSNGRATTNGKSKGKATTTGDNDGSGSSNGGGSGSGGRVSIKEGRQSLSGGAGGNGQNVMSPARSSASPLASAPLPSELQVNSMEDLKALMAVRKLMGRVSVDVDKRAVRGFINGEAIVVSPLPPHPLLHSKTKSADPSL
ncbi:hypothetical protein P7C70_g6549, partial [Phenoliferia sp. Uapishka_3]